MRPPIRSREFRLIPLHRASRLSVTVFANLRAFSIDTVVRRVGRAKGWLTSVTGERIFVENFKTPKLDELLKQRQFYLRQTWTRGIIYYNAAEIHIYSQFEKWLESFVSGFIDGEMI